MDIQDRKKILRNILVDGSSLSRVKKLLLRYASKKFRFEAPLIQLLRWQLESAIDEDDKRELKAAIEEEEQRLAKLRRSKL